MSTADIYGWIEVKQYLWLPLIEATTLIYGSYTTCPIQLPDATYADKSIKLVYDGLPADITERTQHDINRVASYAWGHCWVTWTEIAKTDWQQLRGNWETLFTLMEILALHYAPENVRLIVWATS